MSLVIDMEEALSDPPQTEVWKTLGHQPLLDLLLLALHIMALAVHLNAVNAHYFETAGFYEKLAEALLRLGCFHTEDHDKEKWYKEEDSCPKTAEDNQSSGKTFHQFVELAEALKAPRFASTTPQPSLPVTLRTCIRLMSYLDQFATGTYTPQELNLELQPGGRCEEDKQKINGPADRDGVYSQSPPVLEPGLQFVEDIRGRSRSTAPSISTVCTESEYR